MARGLRRGPVLLRFRSLVDSVAHYVAGIVDTRQLSKSVTPYAIVTSVPSLYFSSRTVSLLQFQRRFQRQIPRGTTCPSTFGVREIPVDSQLRDLIDRHDQQPIMPCFADWIGRLQRCKWLPALPDLRRPLSDHPRRFTLFQLPRRSDCAHCLTTTKNGTTALSP